MTNTIQTVAKELPRPSLRIFMRNYVDKGNREEVMKLTALVKENVVEMVRETDTFPPSIKERLLKRTEAMGATIGYPDHFDPPGTLDKEYEHVSCSSYLTVSSKNRFSAQPRSLRLLLQNVQKTSPTALRASNEVHRRGVTTQSQYGCS